MALWPAGPANNNSVYAGSNLVIPSWTTNEEAAVSLIEFLTRTENQLQYQELTGSLPAGIEATSSYERISVGEEDIQTVCDEMNAFAQNLLDSE